MWLRTPGTSSTSAGVLTPKGYAYQSLLNPTGTKNANFAFPAVWVDKGIFSLNSPNIPDPELPDPIIPPPPVIDHAVVTDGRILTQDLSGDNSDWVEIAKYGDYSLIIRQKYVTLDVHVCCDTYTWSYGKFGENNRYRESRARDRVNMWFDIYDYQNYKCKVCTYCQCTYLKSDDALPKDARIRQYTMQHNVMNTPGTPCNVISLKDGLSKPSNKKISHGTDVAFILSFGEAAEFVSDIRAIFNTGGDYLQSPPEAKANFEKLIMPPKDRRFSLGMWLRTPGALPGTQSAMTDSGYVYHFFLDNTTSNHRGLIYPALWVDSDVFVPDISFINVTHKDSRGGGIFFEEEDIIDMGPYGPYAEIDIPGYAYVGLAVSSDPIAGVAAKSQVVNIVHEYVKLHTVTYHPGAGAMGTGLIVENLHAGSSYTILSSMAAQIYYPDPKYTFRRWNTKYDRTGDNYRVGDVITIEEDLELYGMWDWIE
jgi:hypothetical protein